MDVYVCFALLFFICLYVNGCFTSISLHLFVVKMVSVSVLLSILIFVACILLPTAIETILATHQSPAPGQLR
jgi:hypothetical protein